LALSIDDLYRLEMTVRFTADSFRKHGIECAAADAIEVRSYGDALRAKADSLDVADLLVGCQGNWGVVAPLLRAGHVALRAEFERRKAAKAEAAA
jgi:hypothetical protein